MPVKTQEMWSFLVPCWLLLQHQRMPPLVLLPFLAHYFYRSFLYPLLLRSSKATPLHVWAAASMFTAYNGLLQVCLWLHKCISLSSASNQANGTLLQGNSLICCSDESRYRPLRVWLGLLLWLVGLLSNAHCDQILRNLKNSSGQYQIPRGFLFEYVSCANYTAECIEWMGYAVAAWSWPAAAFAVFTAANLGPRAQQHHHWYKKTFPAYPRTRKAFVPFLW